MVRLRIRIAFGVVKVNTCAHDVGLGFGVWDPFGIQALKNTAQVGHTESRMNESRGTRIGIVGTEFFPVRLAERKVSIVTTEVDPV